MEAAVRKIIPLKPVSSAADIDIDQEVARFEAEERARLGLEDDKPSWFDPVPRHFTAGQRAHTTILCGGLTSAHDQLIEGALTSLGYRFQHLDQPDNEALRIGKEMGNRGQCNPTYFTVGNLIKHLIWLRDEQGLSTQEIENNYLFVTGGSCGPCRFGMYATEYRKALRDAGFPGFRVQLFQLNDGLKQAALKLATGDKPGLEMNTPFFYKMLQAIMLGDVLNLIGYRMRPYEVTPGATDAVLEHCRTRLHQALQGGKRLGPVMRQCRREIEAVALDRTHIRPKVSIIGEFWAMTTEGDGNYGLQRFLEQEGAEVDVQPVTNWLLYMIWSKQFQTSERRLLRQDAEERVEGSTRKMLASMWLADKTVRGVFGWYARSLGLKRYHLPDMEAIAEAARGHYNLNVAGGEGHMEVGKFILTAQQRKATLVISVKPFGCMPSSGVSDGVQSNVTERHPQTLFLPIETSGDGAVNVYSRVQMMLFKARAAARDEVARAEAETGLTAAQTQALARKSPQLARLLDPPPHSYKASTTTANLIYAAAGWRGRLSRFSLARTPAA